MFGRKSPTTKRQWRDAPDPGDVDVLPDPRPDAGLAVTVLRRVLVEVGGTGDTVAGFDVTPVVTAEPLTFTVDALWHGIAGHAGAGADSGVGGGVDTVLNRWNAGHTVPRAHAELDADGRVRVRADSVLTCGAGVTVRQLDEWMRRALAGMSALGEFLDARWPDTETTGAEGADSAEGAEGADSADSAVDAAVADGDITALVTDGNRYGLLGGRTPAVLLPRLGDGAEVKESGASGRRGNGYLRFAAGPDAALHDGTLTVTDGVALGPVDADTLDWLHALCGRANALPGGVVAVVDGGGGGANGVNLTCAVHRPVGSGLSDAQVEHAVSRDRAVVTETLRLLMAEVTGEDDVADGTVDGGEGSDA